MSTKRIEQIIEDIYEFVESCKPIGFKSTKVAVPKDELYDLLDETYNHFKHDPLMGEVYRQLYRERKGYQDIIEDMFIGQTSLYTYRREILYYATMRAVSKQLMEI